MFLALLNLLIAGGWTMPWRNWTELTWTEEGFVWSKKRDLPDDQGVHSDPGTVFTRGDFHQTLLSQSSLVVEFSL